MKKDRIKYRMYGFVPYNISDIQKGIQFGHAVVEYAFQHSGTKEFKEFAREDKTFIILNGGTTNNNEPSGMSSIVAELNNLPAKFKFAVFNEPDLNDALSGVAFLVDSRVWDRETYPCPVDDVSGFYKVPYADRERWLKSQENFLHTSGRNLVKEYKDWVKSIGGETNAFLRYYLSQFKLA